MYGRDGGSPLEGLCGLPDAVAIAQRANERLGTGEPGPSLDALEPTYARGADAKLPKIRQRVPTAEPRS